jgi:hypothetical protein
VPVHQQFLAREVLGRVVEQIAEYLPHTLGAVALLQRLSETIGNADKNPVLVVNDTMTGSQRAWPIDE